MKYEEAKAWIEENTDKKDADRAIKWFCAMIYSDSCREMYNRKDWTHSLLDGEFAVFNSGSAEEIWDVVYSESDDEEILQQMKDHFGK
jgi:hypothetical protein